MGASGARYPAVLHKQRDDDAYGFLGNLRL